MAAPLGIEPLNELLRALRRRGYEFVPPTPATHQRVISRDPRREAATLRDVFGWSLPFREGVLDPEIVALMQQAGVISRRGRHFRSGVRVASLRGDLFLHSAYPPGDDAVFFGPDTYRFVDFLISELDGQACPRSVLDFGAGSGAGAIALARLCRPERLVMADVNPTALTLAAANARFAAVTAELRQADSLGAIDGPFDLVIANPPFIADGGHTYRNGRGMHGAELSLEWIREGARLLTEDGRLLAYTGSAICDGRDGLCEALAQTFGDGAFEFTYREIDPDIFGEELAGPAYGDVERIAAVGVCVRRRRTASERREALEGAKLFLGSVIAGAPPRI